MKFNAVLITFLMASSSAFAGQTDLRIYNALVRAGAEKQEVASYNNVWLKNVDCAQSHYSHKYDCNFDDQLSNTHKEVSGATAKALYNVLEKIGAPADSGMGKMFLLATSIYCTQALDGLLEGSRARHTTCQVELDPEHP